VLDFQRFGLLRCLYGVFTETVKPLIFKALPTSSKPLSLKAFTYLLVLGGWVKGRVLSKSVKFGVKFNKQGLGAWCCVGAK
jgi:hypothetical protein